MLTEIVGRSLTRGRRRKLLTLVAVTLGIAVATAVGTIAFDVGDRVERELRSFGANIALTSAADSLSVSLGGVDYRPAGSGAFLSEDDLLKLKKIFWRNNIMAFAPFLDVPAQAQGRRLTLVGTWFDHAMRVDKSQVFHTGVKSLHPGWLTEGQWPPDSGGTECVVGRRLARALGVQAGSTLPLQVATTGQPPEFNATVVLAVRGIISTGGEEDDQILVPLGLAQTLGGLKGKVRRAEVSALTKPEDAFARSDVTKMSPKEFDRWYCTPYVTAICYQIQQAIPEAEAKPIYRVAATEGYILDRVGALMALLAAAALVTSALAVASMMLATVLERRAEIGLYKSLGASDARVATIFLLEAFVVGLLGGLAGYLTGSLMARHLAMVVFGAPLEMNLAMLPAALALALGVTLAGSALPLARGLRLSPAVVVRNE
jgi:putative ABC transport system permease protein